MTYADGAVKFALAQVGKPYRWGATGPDAFDCSGLIYAAYRSVGLTIPRTTFQQINYGKNVNGKTLMPGDLIFPEPAHVWLYIGNGQVVEAPHTGTNVKVIPLGKYIAARRVDATVIPSTTGITVENAGFLPSPSTIGGMVSAATFFGNPHNYWRALLILAGVVLLLMAFGVEDKVMNAATNAATTAMESGGIK